MLLSDPLVSHVTDSSGDVVAVPSGMTANRFNQAVLASQGLASSDALARMVALQASALRPPR